MDRSLNAHYKNATEATTRIAPDSEQPSTPRHKSVQGSRYRAITHVTQGCQRYQRSARAIDFQSLRTQMDQCEGEVRTNLGAMRPARVMVFSGGGPPLTLPMMSSESPDGTAFTVPLSHPVAIATPTVTPRLQNLHRYQLPKRAFSATRPKPWQKPVRKHRDEVVSAHTLRYDAMRGWNGSGERQARPHKRVR